MHAIEIISHSIEYYYIFDFYEREKSNGILYKINLSKIYQHFGIMHRNRFNLPNHCHFCWVKIKRMFSFCQHSPTVV